MPTSMLLQNSTRDSDADLIKNQTKPNKNKTRKKKTDWGKDPYFISREMRIRKQNGLPGF